MTALVFRNEDDPDLKTVSRQMPLQLQTTHTRKLRIEDQAVHAVPALGRQKVIRRSESCTPYPAGLNKFESVSHRAASPSTTAITNSFVLSSAPIR